MASGYGLSEGAAVMERAGKTGKSKVKIVCFRISFYHHICKKIIMKANQSTQN